MVLALSIPVNSYSAPVLMAGADGCRSDGNRVSVIGLNSTDIRRETADEQCPAQLGMLLPSRLLAGYGQNLEPPLGFTARLLHGLSDED